MSNFGVEFTAIITYTLLLYLGHAWVWNVRNSEHPENVGRLLVEFFVNSSSNEFNCGFTLYRKSLSLNNNSRISGSSKLNRACLGPSADG